MRQTSVVDEDKLDDFIVDKFSADDLCVEVERQKLEKKYNKYI